VLIFFKIRMHLYCAVGGERIQDCPVVGKNTRLVGSDGYVLVLVPKWLGPIQSDLKCFMCRVHDGVVVGLTGNLSLSLKCR
jgi:hypothetical protein